MDAVHATLRRLRNWFVVWFVVQSAAGTIVAAYVVDGLRRHPLLRHVMGGVSTDLTVSAGILGSMLLFVLALLVMASLLDLRPWARIVLLICGWITVVGAVANLLTLPGSAFLLGPAVRAAGGDWQMLEAVSVFTTTADLVFWSWAIYTLQVNPVVRGAFVSAPPEPAGTGSPAQHA